MKVSELIGSKLDYWVAKALGTLHEDGQRVRSEIGYGKIALLTFDSWRPSSSWGYGGPIIERDRIMLDWTKDSDSENPDAIIWMATIYAKVRCTIVLIGKPKPGEMALKDVPKDAHGEGHTALIAAMRAKVASVYGDEVPDETQST